MLLLCVLVAVVAVPANPVVTLSRRADLLRAFFVVSSVAGSGIERWGSQIQPGLLGSIF